MTEVAVRIAVPFEASDVIAVLREAATWLERRGLPLWTEAELDAETIGADVAAGHYAVAVVAAHIVGTARLTWDDALFWPDAAAGEAGYVHRLAVRRAHAGGLVSRALLDWAAAETAVAGRRFLRLDCDAERAQLRALYERFGFRFRDERTVGPYFIARYEKPLAV
jgi:GNAT superfamily N-acetyltransferase